MKTQFLIAASMATLFAAGAHAENHEGKRHGAEMTRADVEARIAERFAKMDADSDGAVTMAEASAAREAMMAKHAERRTQMFDKLDADTDGMVSRTEWGEMDMKRAGKRAERHAQMFDKADADTDGMVSRTEWDAMGAKRAGKHAGMRGGHRGGGKGLIERADADGDGRLTLAEAKTPALARFDRADADKDGVVTAEERQTMHSERRQARDQ